jgi:hypothetical protein
MDKARQRIGAMRADRLVALEKRTYCGPGSAELRSGAEHVA